MSTEVGSMQSRMYENVRTWNPIVGCEFQCVYCVKSFQKQAKRRRKWCEKCYEYTPHIHLERLAKLPNSQTVFACAYGDIAWAKLDWVEAVLNVIERYPEKDFYIQSKNPSVFIFIEDELGIPDNVVLGTTVETDISTFDHDKYPAYHDISHAPLPEDRIAAMYVIKHPRKYVTIEPILEFSTPTAFAKSLKGIEPEFIYVGYDNHNCQLPEPPLNKTKELIAELEKFTEVRLKTIREAWWKTQT